MAHFYNNIASNIQKQITILSTKIDAIESKTLLMTANINTVPTNNKSDEKVDMIKSEVLIIKTDLQKHMSSIKDEIAKERSILESAIMIKVENLLKTHKERTNATIEALNANIMKQVNDIVQQIKVEQQVPIVSVAPMPLPLPLPLPLPMPIPIETKNLETIDINDVTKESFATDTDTQDIEISINKKKTILRRKP